MIKSLLQHEYNEMGLAFFILSMYVLFLYYLLQYNDHSWKNQRAILSNQKQKNVSSLSREKEQNDVTSM
ncbi:hypothetical protein AYO25_03705 [Candidatus Liberibacter solanacearum]|uniref:Uncharacterized protein n=1 Tax=Candidatus Liberibacter solanacearum TaxID=556287 RepID=A0A1V2N7L7_9HYPH|nr:hypothetical protein AYO25_03705 [Candidatus Liberibacter solanacearum]ONI59346.1 hypothetical protein AYJ09_03130 [Candidatus Liberibacter solanacearum]